MVTRTDPVSMVKPDRVQQESGLGGEKSAVHEVSNYNFEQCNKNAPVKTVKPFEALF